MHDNNFDANFVQYQRNLSQNKDTRRLRYNVKVKLACSFLTIIFVSVHAGKKKAVLFHQGRKWVDNNAYIVLSLINSVQNDRQKV